MIYTLLVVYKNTNILSTNMLMQQALSISSSYLFIYLFRENYCFNW